MSPSRYAAAPAPFHAEQPPEQRPRRPAQHLRRAQRYQQLRRRKKGKQRRYHRCDAEVYPIPNPLRRSVSADQEQERQHGCRPAVQIKKRSFQFYHRCHLMRISLRDMHGDRQLCRPVRIHFFTHGTDNGGGAGGEDRQKAVAGQSAGHGPAGSAGEPGVRRGPHGAAGQPVALYRPAPRRAGDSAEAVDINAGTVVVRVQGEGLELVVMTDEELRINGVIRQLQLVE